MRHIGKLPLKTGVFTDYPQYRAEPSGFDLTQVELPFVIRRSAFDTETHADCGR
jgi:hypothetical protein